MTSPTETVASTETSVANKESKSSDLDIRKVLEKSTSDVAIADLAKKGFKQVKVLNGKVILGLIAEAVDRVVASRQQRISSEEREKVIQESQSKFDTMVRDKVATQRALDELGHERAVLEKKVELLQGKVESAASLEAERDRAFSRIEELESGLRRAMKRIEELEAELEARTVVKNEESDERQRELRNEVETLKQECDRLRVGGEQARQLKDRVLEKQQEIDALRGKADELEKKLAAQDENEGMNQLAAKIMAKLEEKQGGGGDVTGLEASIQNLADRVMSLGPGGGGGGAIAFGDNVNLERLFASDDGKAVESNVNEVKVKESKAGGVKNTLAKLKALQKGGTKDGE